MTDDIIKELWDTKDNIAGEHSYSIDKLAEYYLRKQASRQNQAQQNVPQKESEKIAGTDSPTVNG